MCSYYLHTQFYSIKIAHILFVYYKIKNKYQQNILHVITTSTCKELPNNLAR